MGADLGEIRGVISLTDQFSRPAGDVVGKLGTVGDSLRAVGALGGLVTGAVTAIGGSLVALGNRGSAVINMRDSFAALTGSIGETSDAMLGSIRGATQGLISDMDIMAATNKAVLLGLPVTAESMGTLAQSAVVLGRAMGQDASKSIDDLTTALGRSSPMILDNLGLSVKVSEANETYARSLGKSATQLTDAEKKQAFYNAAMAAAQKKVTELGGIHLTFADRINIAKNQLGGFLDNFGVAIARSPALAAGMDVVQRAIGGAFGGNQKALIQTLMGYVTDFAIGVTYVGQAGVIAGQVLVAAWYAVKTAFAAVMTVIAAVGGAMVGLVAGIAEMGASIPIVGDKIKGFAEGAKNAELFMAELTRATAAETAENAKAAMGNNVATEALTKMGVGLFDVRGAIESMAGAEVDLTTKTRTRTTASKDAADAAQRDAEAIAAAQRRLETDLITGMTMGIEQRVTLNDIAREEELAKLSEYTGLTGEEYERMVGLINEKYTRMNDLAKASGDEIRTTETTLRNDIALAQATGMEQQLLGLEFKKQAELAALGELAVKYPETYVRIADLVTQKYAGMTAAAQGHFSTVQQAAEAAGFRTQEELQRTADEAQETYRRMQASGLYSTETLQRAHERAEQAKQEASRTTGELTTGYLMDSASRGIGILRSLFGKNKTLASAEVILSTAKGVMGAMSQLPSPKAYVDAALVVGMGVAQLVKIHSASPGFAEGTPGLDYQNYGRGTMATLHGPEAIVPKRRVGEFAHDVAALLANTAGGGAASSGPITINLMLPSGRKIAEAFVPELPAVLATYGLRG